MRLAVLVLGLALGGCAGRGAPPPAPARAPRPAPAPLRADVPRVDARLAAMARGPRGAGGAGAGPAPPGPDAAPARDEPPTAPPLRLTLDAPRLALPAGRSVVAVEVRAGSLTSIGVFGPADALLGFDLVPSGEVATARAHSSLDEDGMLPRVVSLAPRGDGGAEVLVVVDVASPVELARVASDPRDAVAPKPLDLKRGLAEARPLVGLPAPRSRDDGYLLQSPARYQFLRVDVAEALVAALRQTRVRFRRDPIAVADVSQWDGVRPATDLGRPRHISHEGGRDVDIALPADDGEASTVRVHCTGVLVEADVYGCAPGTARGVDALRLAYLLGLLADGAPGVEKIFIDEQYLREVHKAADVLRERRWIKDVGFAALTEEGVLRASPWHTDHVHVRFVGEHGRPPW